MRCWERVAYPGFMQATTAGGRRVAVKLPCADAPPAASALIRREFEFLSAISHPGVVAVSGLVRIPRQTPTAGHDPGIVMEYLGGGDLVSLTGSSPWRWVPVAARVARAVDDLHGAGIVHRDLKPRNVLLGSGDVPRLIDFALAARIGGAAPRGGGTAAYQRGGRFEEAEAARRCLRHGRFGLRAMVRRLALRQAPDAAGTKKLARNSRTGTDPGDSGSASFGGNSGGCARAASGGTFRRHPTHAACFRICGVEPLGTGTIGVA